MPSIAKDSLRNINYLKELLSAIRPCAKISLAVGRQKPGIFPRSEEKELPYFI